MNDHNVYVEFQAPNSAAIVLTYNNSKFGFHPLDMSKSDRLKLICALSQPEIKNGACSEKMVD